MSARVLCTLPLPDPYMQIVSAVADVTVLGRIPSTDEMCELVSATQFDVLCPQLRDPMTPRVFDAAGEQLRAVCVYAVGFNNVDVAAATQRSIAVGNTPGVLTDATADCTFGLILAAARRLAEGDRVMRRGGYTGWTPDFMLGLELHNATLGVVGLGRIGQAVARRARASGMNVVHYTEGDDVAIAPDVAEYARAVSFDELLQQSDVVTLHVPLMESTHHLINAGALAKMKPTAVLVNTSRGPVIDEPALVAALRTGVIAGAGLDVYENEPAMAPGLAELDNVVLAPHLGSATVHTRSEMARLCAENAAAAIAGRLPAHCVNKEVAQTATWLGKPLS